MKNKDDIKKSLDNCDGVCDTTKKKESDFNMLELKVEDTLDTAINVLGELERTWGLITQMERQANDNDEKDPVSPQQNRIIYLCDKMVAIKDIMIDMSKVNEDISGFFE